MPVLVRPFASIDTQNAVAPIMSEVVRAARDGMPVLGICNGFQVLCESHLLPGALIRNAGLHFTCLDQRLRVGTEGGGGHEHEVGLVERDGRDHRASLRS